MFICEDCQNAHHRKGIETHLRNQHQVSLLNDDHIQLGTIADSFQVLDFYPPFDADHIYGEFSGIRVQDVYVCPECHYTSTNQRTVKAHIKKQHGQGNSVPISGFAQVINAGAARTLLRINSKTVVKTGNSTQYSFQRLLDKLQQFDWKSIPQPIPNTRQISPFLLRTQWYLHVQQYDNESLRALVAPVARDEKISVCSVIGEYFGQCTELLDQGKTHCSVLEILNSPDPNQ